MYDLIIIGAGPAGISAGIYAVSRGLKTVVIEKNRVGGIIGNVSTVTHYTAVMEGETGESFADRMREQALNAGVEIVYETVTEVSLSGEEKRIVTEKAVYTSPKVILANGCTPNKFLRVISQVSCLHEHLANAAKVRYSAALLLPR